MRAIEKLVDYSSENSLGFKLRKKRATAILELIRERHQKLGRKIRIVDLGGVELYWKIFDIEELRSLVEEIVLVNLEKYPVKDESLFSSMAADARNIEEFGRDSCDMVHSNSVIEHTGDWRSMESFAAQVRRMAPVYYVQTPYFWFPVEPHFVCPFFHWLPEAARVKLLMWFSLGNYPKIEDFSEATKAVQGARLLDMRQMRVLFPDAEIKFERFFGLPKSMVATKLAP